MEVRFIADLSELKDYVLDLLDEGIETIHIVKNEAVNQYMVSYQEMR